MEYFKTLCILLLASLASQACAKPVPIPPGTDTYFYGYISKGVKFGVAVGDSRLTARTAMLKQGFAFAGTADCTETNLRFEIGCRRGVLFDFYDKHRGLGHETVFLELRGERIAMIGWSFVLVQIDS